MKGNSLIPCTQQRAQARFLWFDKQPVSNTGFHALDESIWKPLLSAEGRADPETALEKLALLTVDESGITRATVAGVLLCSAAPHEWLGNPDGSMAGAATPYPRFVMQSAWRKGTGGDWLAPEGFNAGTGAAMHRGVVSLIGHVTISPRSMPPRQKVRST